VSRYEKGKTNLDFTEARESEWQWHQLCQMQVCTSPQTDNHASTPPLSFSGRMPFLPPNQQRQSTEGKTYLLTYLRVLCVVDKTTWEHFKLPAFAYYLAILIQRFSECMAKL